MPKSRLRGILLKVSTTIGYVLSALSAVYVISPADIIPDIIPLLGQIDDILVLVAGIFSAVAGWKSTKSLRNNKYNDINKPYDDVIEVFDAKTIEKD
jgi:uncharacterized membrane protein YkvA (DUF1232 family)